MYKILRKKEFKCNMFNSSSHVIWILLFSMHILMRHIIHFRFVKKLISFNIEKKPLI